MMAFDIRRGAVNADYARRLLRLPMTIAGFSRAAAYCIWHYLMGRYAVIPASHFRRQRVCLICLSQMPLDGLLFRRAITLLFPPVKGFRHRINMNFASTKFLIEF